MAAEEHVDDDQAWREAASEEGGTSDGGSPPARAVEPVSNPVLESLQRRGYDVDGIESDDRLLEQLAGAMDSMRSAPDEDYVRRMQQMEPLLQEFSQNRDKYEQWRKSQEEQVPEQEPEVPKWKAPQLSDRTAGWIESGMFGRTEDGKLGLFNQLTGKVEYDPRFASEIREAEQFINWQASVGRRIARNPLEVLREAGLGDEVRSILGDEKWRTEIKKELEESIRKSILTDLDQRESRRARESEINQNAKMFFEHDQSGNMKMQTVQGKQVPVLTEIGKAYEQAVLEAHEEFGIEDDDKLHRYAMRQVAPMLGSSKGAGDNKEAKEQRQETFLEKVRNRGNGRQRQSNRVFPESQSVATEAARESAHDRTTDEEAWQLSKQEAANDLV